MSNRPIFIVGAPRSGTTLIRSILDAHPRICCPTWETGVFDRLGPLVNGDFSMPRGEEANFATIERADLIRWMRTTVDSLMELLTASTGKPRWGEKTPAHVFHIDLIREVYPDAQFLHIIRNGWQVIRSLQNMPFGPRTIRWSTSRWIDSVTAGRRAGSQLPRGQYLEMRYERLLADPAGTLREVCDFLGEEYLADMLEFHDPTRNSWGIRQRPLSDRPLNQHAGLRPHEKVFVAWKARGLLRELGYGN